MNTLPPPDNLHISRVTVKTQREHPQNPDLFWLLVDEQGTSYSNADTDWNQLATMYQEPDSLICYPTTRMPIVSLTVMPLEQECPLHIMPPEPVPFFSFARYALPCDPAHSFARVPSIWLYSVFGYFFANYRFTWKLFADQTSSIHVTPRTVPLLLS